MTKKNDNNKIFIRLFCIFYCIVGINRGVYLPKTKKIIFLNFLLSVMFYHKNIVRLL